MARQDSAGGATAQSVRQALGPVVDGLGLVLEDVTVTPAGSRRVLRVVLDVADESADEGLSLDAVAEASREISTALDADDVMGATPYVLEVSSPGVDRPLTERRHFRRNLRRTVEVTLADGSAVTGRITAADDHLVLAVPGAKKGMPAKDRELAWDDVERALVQVEFKALDESGE
ncbi:ribosome maturation factor RimP [Angustibacter peucedani]